MSKDIVINGYNKVAKRYMAARDLFVNSRYVEKLDSLLKPDSLILDLGCGSGKPIDKFFVYRGHQVIGIDIAKKQIKLARKNVPRARYLVKDISDLRKEEFSVDAVVSFYTIIHVPRETHQELFQKINSFLPAGGLVLVTMGSSERQGTGDFYGVDMYWSQYGPDKNREIIQKAGFEIILEETDATGTEKHQVILATKLPA